MAEYNEVIKQFKRMCWYFSRDKMQKSCPMCTSYPNCNIGQCRKFAFEKPDFEATVMRWAAEHPVVYPTWREYLMSLIMPYGTGDWSTLLLEHRISADIASKLGIQPKEGNHD